MTDFEHDVTDWVAAAVKEGPTSFDDLVCQLPGVYPTDAREALKRLFEQGRMSASAHARSIARRTLPSNSPRSMGFSIPHPLDFDWRFSDAGLAAIVGVMNELSDRTTPVVCLGAPSIVRLLQLENDPRPATLLDANPRHVEVIQSQTGPHKALLCDLGSNSIPKVNAQVVLIDPPWYPEHFRIFLWAAARILNDGGHLLASFPAAGTRPGVTAERDEALAWAAKLGLGLQEIRRGAVGYRSPPFEQSALEAEGIGDLPSDWRHGDLLILRKVRETPDVPRPKPVPDQDWRSILGHPTEIRVRDVSRGQTIDPRIFSIVNGDVLPSVSRRDSRRTLVDVWTANNRVFGCANTRILREIAGTINTIWTALDAVSCLAERALTMDEIAHITCAEEQLGDLIEREVADLRRHHWLVET